MIVAKHIIELRPIDENASRTKCIELMMDNLCYELPVMRKGKLYGTVELDECLHSEEETVVSLVDVGFASIHFNSHLFDALKVFNESKANVCSVLDDNMNWMGIITKTVAVEALAQSLTVDQLGAVIVIEMATHHYSVNEISRIIESEGAQLLGLWLTNVAESGRIRASLKINTQNAERIISGLQRFNYEVVATFGDDDYKENVERRFESLMKYIDI